MRIATPKTRILPRVVGGEIYIARFDNNSECRNQTMQTLDRWADNKDLALTWYDAAILCQRIRSQPCYSPDQEVVTQ